MVNENILVSEDFQENETLSQKTGFTKEITKNLSNIASALFIFCLIFIVLCGNGKNQCND